MVLDDCIDAIRQMRRVFRLPEARFGLQDIERYATAKSAVADFIEATMKKHDSGIFARPGLLMPDAGHKVFYDEPVGNPDYPRYRFLPDCARQALRRTLEEAFQTVAQLPSEFPVPVIFARDITSLVSLLNKCADKINAILKQWLKVDDGLRNVLNFSDLGRLAEKLKGEGQSLEQAVLKSSRMERVRLNSPNPQVSLILYLADWIEVGTDKKRYKLLETLASAAFVAAGKQSPKWIDRLAVEMARKKALRRKWVRRISS